MALKLVVLVCLCLSLFITAGAMSMWCDHDNCYELLGVKQTAAAGEIKKAYYKLSMKLHPDKNPDPEAHKQFAKVANAYEILKEDDSRGQYDYALAHPEQFFYNMAQYYRSQVVGLKADLRLVILGPLVFVSALQWLNSWMRYDQVVKQVKQTPAYRNKIRAMELDKERIKEAEKGGAKRRPRSSKNSGKGGDARKGTVEADDLDAELVKGGMGWGEVWQKILDVLDGKVDEGLQDGDGLELDIMGAQRPSVWGLLIIQILILPYTFSKWILWSARWVILYYLRRSPYHLEDAAYLTRCALHISEAAWLAMSNRATSLSIPSVLIVCSCLLMSILFCVLLPAWGSHWVYFYRM